MEREYSNFRTVYTTSRARVQCLVSVYDRPESRRISKSSNTAGRLNKIRVHDRTRESQQHEQKFDSQPGGQTQSTVTVAEVASNTKCAEVSVPVTEEPDFTRRASLTTEVP